MLGLYMVRQKTFLRVFLKAVYYDGYIDQTVTDFGWRFSPGEDGEWYIEDFTELSNMGDHI